RATGAGRERAVNIGCCSPERQRTADRRTPQARRKKGGEGAGHLAGGGRIPYISGPLHDMSLPLLAFFTALAVSLAGAALLVRRPEAGRQARPREAEGSPAVPRIGGIAVLAGLVAGVLATLWWSGWSGTLFHATRYQWIGWILAGGSLFLWGLVDDLRRLSP